MSADYIIVLQITTDDDADDPRRWLYDELLAAPDDDPARFVKYVTGAKVDRA